MKYRAEVDGLRTIAVVPVIFFHAGLSEFSGGYVGVDVFFVISGYLITGILAEEMAEGRFSLMNFYERRARRILPALFVVMALCIPFAWMWMLPFDMLNFTRSLVAVSFFASNVMFYIQAGYFGPNAEELPLLHTWSLAVEEQFYIFFPLLLLLIWRLGRGAVIGILGGVTLASLAFCHLLIIPEPDATFYLIHTRAWELFVGALVALWQRRTGMRVQGANEFGAGAGLLMVLWGIFMFDKQTPFPSFWAVLPVGGAALILMFAGPGTVVARLLSLKPMVWIGLISYSAYLIHQPLLAFARIRTIGEPEHWVMYGLAVLTFPLAWVNWRFVEQPFRNKAHVGRAAIFAGSAMGLAAFITVGMAGHVTRGMPGRLPEEALQIASIAQERNPKRSLCLTWDVPDEADPRCVSEGFRTVAILGDSHADALAFGLRPALQQAGYGVYEATAQGCWPLPGFRRMPDLAATCSGKNEAVWQIVDRRADDVVVLSARWSVNVLGTRFDNEEGGVEAPKGHAALEPLDWQGRFGAVEDLQRRARVLARLDDELRKLLDEHTIVLVYPVPEAGWDVPSEAVKALLQEYKLDLSTSYARYKFRNDDVIALFESISHPNLYRVRPQEVFCDTFQPERCATMLNGKPLYRDDNHLSRLGAELLSEKVLDVIATIPMDIKDFE